MFAPGELEECIDNKAWRHSWSEGGWACDIERTGGPREVVCAEILRASGSTICRTGGYNPTAVMRY